MNKYSLFIIASITSQLSIAGEPQIQSSYFTGDLTSYLAAWSTCGNKINSFKRGEYESKEEFDSRKNRASDSCGGFSNVTAIVPWQLNYDADLQRFIINLKDTFRGMTINGLVEARGDGKKPGFDTSCENQIVRGETCTRSVDADCVKPLFSMNPIISRIAIDSKCTQSYSLGYRGVGGWSDQGYRITYNVIAIHVRLDEARRLKSRESSLFIEITGVLGRSGDLTAKTFRIMDKSSGENFVSWGR